MLCLDAGAEPAAKSGLFQAAVSAGLALSEAEQEEDQTLRTREIRPHGGWVQVLLPYVRVDYSDCF